MTVDMQIRQQANVAFRFVVKIDNEAQAAFTECTLPNLELEMEEVKEGGLNSYIHQLPGRRKSARVSLKNGVGKSKLLDWYMEAISKTAKRKNITISLLDAHHNDVLVWHVQDAYPVKWTGPSLKSSDNSIAIQTLELVCGEVTITSA